MGWLVVTLIIVGVGYLVSLKLNPWVTCSKCHGKPKSQGWLYSHAHHICSKCGGSGQQPRLGRKLFSGMRQP